MDYEGKDKVNVRVCDWPDGALGSACAKGRGIDPYLDKLRMLNTCVCSVWVSSLIWLIITQALHHDGFPGGSGIIPEMVAHRGSPGGHAMQPILNYKYFNELK